MRYKNYTIVQGDTLQLIAQAHMGAMSEWVTLAQYNNLRHPYITENPEDKITNHKIVVVGDTIVIPMDMEGTREEDYTMTLDSRNIVEEIALGRDFCLTKNLIYASTHGTHDEILELTTAPNGGIGYVKGMNNLRQALLQRLWTKRGTLPLHPQYGSDLHQFIGSRVTKELMVRVALEIEATCRVDPRVSDITDIKTTHNTKDNSIHVSMRIQPTSFAEMLDFVIDIADSGAITLND